MNCQMCLSSFFLAMSMSFLQWLDVDTDKYWRFVDVRMFVRRRPPTFISTCGSPSDAGATSCQEDPVFWLSWFFWVFGQNVLVLSRERRFPMCRKGSLSSPKTICRVTRPSAMSYVAFGGYSCVKRVRAFGGSGIFGWEWNISFGYKQLLFSTYSNSLSTFVAAGLLTVLC